MHDTCKTCGQRLPGGRLLLAAIRRLLRQNSKPTVTALMAATGQSRQFVRHWLPRLEESGQIVCDRDMNGRRLEGAIRIVGKGEK